MASDLHGNLRPGVPGAHDQHCAFLNLGRVAILLRVELDDASIQLARERRNSRIVVGAGRHDYVLGEQRVLARGHFESIPGLRQSVDLGAGSDRELERAGICFQIVGGLVLGRISPGRSRKRHTRQPVVADRRKQTQRIPPLPPGITDAVVLVQDDERQIPLLEVIAGSQTGLAATDHDGSHGLFDHVVLALDSIDFPPAALHEVVIIGHRLRHVLVRRKLLLDGEEVIDLLDLRLSDDGPERLTCDVSEQAHRFVPHLLERVRDRPNLSAIWRTLPGLQCKTSRITYMTRSFQTVLTDDVSASFAAAMMRPMFSLDMKSGNGMAPVIADRNAFVASWL